MIWLCNGKCAIDEDRIFHKDGLCSCSCELYMHYLVWEHVLADAILKGSILVDQSNFDQLNFGWCVCRQPKAVAGKQLGKA